MLDAPPNSSSPYRTSELLELTVELDEQKREVDRLRAWKKRSRVGVILALAVACVHVAAFSGVLMLRYVPKQAAEPAPAASACPSVAEAIPAVPDPPPPPPPPIVDPGPPEPSALEQLGGEEKVAALATEITRALYANPVIARSPRIMGYGRARLETLVRQQLQTMLGATSDPDPIDPFEAAWELRPTHAEWAAVTDVVDKVLQKHDLTEANRSSVTDQISSNEASATDDIPKRRAGLHGRAAVGLGCDEGAISSRPLETTDSRIVNGCGKSAIYNYVSDPNTGTLAWHRETTP